MPRKPTKRVEKGTPRWYRDRCDDLWEQRVKEAADFHCEKCGKSGPGLQAHHHIPRTVSRLRFDLRNGVCLCYRHHIHWAHKDIEAYRAWFKGHRPDDHAYVTQGGHRLSLRRTLFEWEELYALLKSGDIQDIRDDYARLREAA